MIGAVMQQQKVVGSNPYSDTLLRGLEDRSFAIHKYVTKRAPYEVSSEQKTPEQIAAEIQASNLNQVQVDRTPITFTPQQEQKSAEVEIQAPNVTVQHKGEEHKIQCSGEEFDVVACPTGDVLHYIKKFLGEALRPINELLLSILRSEPCQFLFNIYATLYIIVYCVVIVLYIIAFLCYVCDVFEQFLNYVKNKLKMKTCERPSSRSRRFDYFFINLGTYSRFYGYLLLK
jgi:hypothetical protein